MVYTLVITEEQRRLILMALAHLAIETGWDQTLSEIAARIDDPAHSMFAEFKGYKLSASSAPLDRDQHR